MEGVRGEPLYAVFICCRCVFLQAFAGQVLSNIKAMDSDLFFGQNMPGTDKVGEPPTSLLLTQ